MMRGAGVAAVIGTRDGWLFNRDESVGARVCTTRPDFTLSTGIVTGFDARL